MKNEQIDKVERVALFSTYNNNIYKSIGEDRSLFVSEGFCDFFIKSVKIQEKVPDFIKVVYDRFEGLKKLFCKNKLEWDDDFELFPDLAIESLTTNEKVKKELMEEVSSLKSYSQIFEEIEGLSIEDKIDLISKIPTDGEQPSINIYYGNKGEHDKSKPHLYNRFSLYKVPGGDSTCSCYCVYPLDPGLSSKYDKTEWFDALTEEIILRHPNCKLLVLALHGGDVPNVDSEFYIEESDKNRKSKDGWEYKRSIALFHHTPTNPINKILSGESINACDLFTETYNLVSKRKILEMLSEKLTCIPYNEQDFIETLNSCPDNDIKKGLLACSSLIERITMINDQIKDLIN